MRDVIIAKRKADEALMKADYPAYLNGLRDFQPHLRDFLNSEFISNFSHITYS